jgi:hypothetical protein
MWPPRNPAPHFVPRLAPILHLHVQVSPAIDGGQVFHDKGQGRRRIVPITGGSFTGQARGMPLSGMVLPGGADFQLIPSETTALLDARYLLRLDDGSHIFVRNRAIRKGAASDVAQLQRGESVPPERLYFRCSPRFDVENPQLAWMSETIFVGTGARSPEGVELWFYELM